MKIKKFNESIDQKYHLKELNDIMNEMSDNLDNFTFEINTGKYIDKKDGTMWYLPDNKFNILFCMENWMGFSVDSELSIEDGMKEFKKEKEELKKYLDLTYETMERLLNSGYEIILFRCQHDRLWAHKNTNIVSEILLKIKE